MNTSEMAKILYDGNEDVIRRKSDATRIMRSAFRAIREGLLRDGSVAVEGVGRIWLELRRPYWHPHPKTQELILVPAKLIVKFRASQGTTFIREIAKRDLSWVDQKGTLDDPCPNPDRLTDEHDVYVRKSSKGRIYVCRACGACSAKEEGMRR